MTTHHYPAGYVDTTALIPDVTREQPVAELMQQRLERIPLLLSANLLEAEMRETYAQEGQPFDRDALSEIRWIMPNRPLDTEMAAIAEIAPLPAARLWHLAVALFFAELVPGVIFITLDEQQEAVARDLGMAIP